MSEYYHVVPWYSSEEWRHVYDLLFTTQSTLQNKQKAHNLLLLWKARCPSLPSGVESTLCLLEVYIEDAKNSYELNDQLLRLAYSSAIMRFVNHMLDSEIAKGISLYQAAKTLGVPDWIIDLRHDTAHNNKLPSVELLREATVIGLEWLQKNYWEKYKEFIQDYRSGQKETGNVNENKIATLMSFCISLSICLNTKQKIKTLSVIPDSMKESILNDARDLFGSLIDLSNLKKVSITSLTNLLNSHSKTFLKSDTAPIVNKVLLGEDSLFLSFELLSFMDNKEFCHKNVLDRQYVQCFEILLTLLHSNDLLQDFVIELINITNSDDNESAKRRLACLWVSQILRALKKSKQFHEKVKQITSDNVTQKTRQELKALYHHWFPNEKVNEFFLDMLKPVPEDLMNIDFIRPIISTYNPYLTYFVKDLLNLLEPCLPTPTSERICQLASLISGPENISAPASKIYTVEDLNIGQGNLSISRSDEQVDSDCYEISFEMEVEMNCSQHVKNKTWNLASTNYDWSACPIGVLPWHLNNDNQIEDS